MSGFQAWAAGIQGTAAIAGCVLVAGFLLGWAWALRDRHPGRRERLALAERAGERAAGEFRDMRLELHHEADPEHAARRAAMARRTHPVYRRRAEIVDGPKRTAAFLDPAPEARPESDEEWAARMYAMFGWSVPETIHGGGQ